MRTGRLPTPPAPLIGRDWEVSAIRHALVQDECRLLTLWGPPGIGKTRLALAVAADSQVTRVFDDDVAFVDLAPVADASGVLPAIADAFGLGDTPGRLFFEQFETHLYRRRALLVLDNLEHVLDFAPQLAPMLVSCPSLKILATSRAALRLRWEHAFPVAQLRVPEVIMPTDAATASSYAGVAFFVERARAARPNFQLTDANASAVAEVCARLEGLPLAIELAAARIKGLPLLVLLKRLDDPLAFLQAGAPDLPARQQTLRKALVWSYDLLNADQQTLFRRLGAFVEGCSPEAAEAVCSDATLASDVLEGLAVLVQHSLLRLDEGSDGQPRYTMMSTIRGFAAEQLARNGEADETRRRHAAYFLALTEEADSRLSGPEQVAWLDRLEREHPNLRAALRWAVHCGETDYGLRLGIALRRFWSIRGHLTEGRTWLTQLLALPPDAEPGSAQARALAAAGCLAAAQGEYAEAHSLQEQSLALCRQLGDDQGIADALRLLGVLANYAHDPVTARARFEESLAIYQAIGFAAGAPQVLLDLGNMCLDEGELTAAGVHFNQCLSLRRELADPRGIALALLGLSRVALGQSEFDSARCQLEEALGILRRLGDHQSIASVLELFACLAARRGGTGRALRLVAASESLRAALGVQPSPDWQADLETYRKVTRDGLGPSASAVAHAAGRSMLLEDAIKLCLEENTLVQASECPDEVMVNGVMEEFTRREREVIELAIRGWSNRQIAAELVISERTAEGHIHNILGKLQLDSRARLVAWGARLGQGATDKEPPSHGLPS